MARNILYQGDHRGIVSKGKRPLTQLLHLTFLFKLCVEYCHRCKLMWTVQEAAPTSRNTIWRSVSSICGLGTAVAAEALPRTKPASASSSQVKFLPRFRRIRKPDLQILNIPCTQRKYFSTYNGVLGLKYRQFVLEYFLHVLANNVNC